MHCGRQWRQRQLRACLPKSELPGLLSTWSDTSDQFKLVLAGPPIVLGVLPVGALLRCTRLRTSMHPIVNRILFGVLVGAGCSLVSATYMLSPDNSVTSFLLGTGIFLGWLGAILSGISFLIATLLFAANRLVGYWHSLCPVNFGLALSGVCFVRYVETAASVAMVSAAVGLACARPTLRMP